MESKYYYLQEGDVITEADEYRRDNGQWTLGTGVYGQVFDSKRHKLHRRWAESTPCASSEHTKDTNPKDAIGSTKPPIANVPLSVISEVGMALAEGQWKYGGYNWRVIGVRASVYWDATFRHIKAWWEGEDTDPDSQLSHVTKAISALTVLRDAMIQDNWTDDRPPRSKQTPTQVSDLYKQMLERLKSLQPDPVSGYTQKGQDDVRQA